MRMFDTTEESEYACPKCSGNMVKVTRPVNVQVYQCVLCEEEFGSGYLEGWKEAKKDGNDRLEGMIDHMAERLAPYVTVAWSVNELIKKVSQLLPSQNRENILMDLADIHKRLKDAERTTLVP